TRLRILSDLCRFQRVSFDVHAERASGHLGATEALSLFATNREPLYALHDARSKRCSRRAHGSQSRSWMRRATPCLNSATRGWTWWSYNDLAPRGGLLANGKR